MTLGWSFIQAKHSGFDSSQCLGLTACLRSSLQPLSIVWLTKPYTTMCECVCVLFWFCWATINTYTTVGMIGQGYLQPQSINFWPTFNSLASLCTHAVLLSRLCDSSSLSRPDNSAISFLESRNELPLLSGIYIWSTPKINVIYFTITTNLTAILTCNTKISYITRCWQGLLRRFPSSWDAKPCILFPKIIHTLGNIFFAFPMTRCRKFDTTEMLSSHIYIEVGVNILHKYPPLLYM